MSQDTTAIVYICIKYIKNMKDVVMFKSHQLKINSI